MVRRFTAGAAVGTALVVSLTGCFGDSGGDKKSGGAPAGRLSAAQVLDRTSQKTSQVKSFKATLSMNGTMQGKSIKMDGTAQYRLKPSLAMNMNFTDISMGGKTIGGMQELLVGDTVYVKSSMLSKMAGGKPWLKVSLSKLGKHSGMDLDALLKQSQQFDPARNVKMFTASKDVKKLGTKTIDGVETTHYRGTYAVEKALAKLDADQRNAARKKLAAAGIDKMAFDLWVDAKQLPRKMVMKTPDGAKARMTVTAKYSDYNEPVTINTPPAGQTIDFGDLLGNLGGGMPSSMPSGIPTDMKTAIPN